MQTALVTGAAKRVGKAIALRLADEGYDIIVHYRGSEKEARETAQEIMDKGRKAEIKSADLTDTSKINELVDFSLRKFNTIDVLVNNAATFYRNPLKELDTGEKFREAMYASLDSNVIGPLWLARQIGYHMKEKQKSGLIVIIGDHAQVTDRYYPDYFPYHVSKGAL